MPLDLSVNFEETSNPSSFGTWVPLFPLENKGKLTKAEGRAIPQSTESLQEILPYSLLYPGKKMSSTNQIPAFMGSFSPSPDRAYVFPSPRKNPVHP